MNVGSLLVARASARARETAVKAALGASAGRLVRQHVVESLVLAALGAGLGLLLGRWGLAALQAATPDALSRLRVAAVDAAGRRGLRRSVMVLWMVALAAAPASEALRVGVARALQHDGRRAGGGRRRLRAALTVAQIALSVVLVLGALLLIRTVQRIQQVAPGFESEGVLSFRVALPGSRYPNQDAFNAFSRRLQDALAAMPGATAAAAVSHAPYDHVPNWGGPYVATEGADASTAPQADYRAVAPGLMELLGVTARRGPHLHRERRPPRGPGDDRRRAAGAADVAGRSRRSAGGSAADPTVAGTPSTWTTVVGVVRHVRHRTPTEEVRDQVYFPSRQVVRNPSVYMIKTTADPATLVGPVHEAVRALDPALPIYDVRPLDAYVNEARALRRFTAVLAALFAPGGADPGLRGHLRRGRLLGHRAPPRIRRAAGVGRASIAGAGPGDARRRRPGAGGCGDRPDRRRGRRLAAAQPAVRRAAVGSGEPHGDAADPRHRGDHRVPRPGAAGGADRPGGGAARGLILD